MLKILSPSFVFRRQFSDLPYIQSVMKPVTQKEISIALFLNGDEDFRKFHLYLSREMEGNSQNPTRPQIRLLYWDYKFPKSSLPRSHSTRDYWYRLTKHNYCITDYTFDVIWQIKYFLKRWSEIKKLWQDNFNQGFL